MKLKKRYAMSKKLSQILLTLVLFSLTAHLTSSQVFAQESFNISLKSGKNLVALPLNLQNRDIQSVFSSIIGAVKDVWGYQSSDTNDPWKHYRPGLYGYSDLREMSVAKGYWIILKSDALLQVTGTPVAENITLNLKQGWNIIGWPYQYPQQITLALSGLIFGVDYNQVCRFNNTTQSQENFLNQPGDDFTFFEPTQAYYIHMLKDKTISLLLDITSPTGSIKINNDNPYTQSTSVTLTLSAQDNPEGSGISQMQFSNDNSTYSTPEDYSTTKSWTLTSGDGQKTVYVKFKDVAGNWSEAFSDTITLDKTPPVVIITSPSNGTIVEAPQVQLQGTIDGVSFSETRTLTQDGENILTKTATDTAGNTASASVTVYLYMGELIGPEGGEVISPDGKVKVVIPQGALTQPTHIKILNINTAVLEAATPSNRSLLSAVECKPYGLNFNSAVSIIYTLSQAEVPGTLVELGLYDADQDKIIPTGQLSTVPSDGYTLTFSITGFSTYVALKNLTPQSTPIGSGVKIPLPDMLTGSFSQVIPITIPPGRKGIQPALSLNYRSSNANSWVGQGFSLNPGYIVRSTRLGPPTYIDTQDTFYFITDAGTTELVNLIDNLYQAKVESSFTKFFKEPDDTWRAVTKDGSILRFGQTFDSKETSTSGTFTWYLTKVIDTNGNYIEYHYTKDQGKSYLSRIDYTGNEIGISPTNYVEFFLESRNDISSSYISSSKVTTAKRLKEIQVKQNYDLVWRYVLEYEYSPDTNRSLLKSITQYGSDGKSLPTQGFEYQKAR